MCGPLAVFVNSSDGFQDCWPPFFNFFRRYGGMLCDLPLFLNTERASCCCEGLAVTSTLVWPIGEVQRPTWSECLVRGLRRVNKPYVLYLQEDYFLKRRVDDSQIAAALDLVSRDPEVGVVYLNKHGPAFQRSRPYSKGFVEICRPARYTVSTQAAIWRIDFLLSLIRPWENGWMFEKFGSARSRHARQKLLSVSPEIMAASPVVDYVYTGVIKGKWNTDCKMLFEEHDIQIDLTHRGFYHEVGRLVTRFEVLKKLMSEPVGTLRSIANLFCHPRAM